MQGDGSLQKEKEDSDKPLISDDELAEAYETLKEISASFDYDSLQFVLKSLEDYRLPEKEIERYKKLKIAAEKLADLSADISAENKIETLVSAKGVDNCLAVMNNEGNRVDVIVDAEELSDTLILQVKEIAMRETGCTFEEVSVIQSK